MVWEKVFSHLRNVQTGSVAYPASYAVGTGVLTLAGVKLTTYLNPVPWFRMSGAIPPLSNTCLHGVDKENFAFYLMRYADRLGHEPAKSRLEFGPIRFFCVIAKIYDQLYAFVNSSGRYGRALKYTRCDTGAVWQSCVALRLMKDRKNGL